MLHHKCQHTFSFDPPIIRPHTRIQIYIYIYIYIYIHTYFGVPFSLVCLQLCLKLEPNDRKGCSELLKCPYFTHDSFDQMFTVELRGKIMKDMEENPLVKNLGVTIHGSAHDYLMSQQQSTAPPAVLQTSLTDLIDGTVDVARKEEKKKVKKKVTKAKKVCMCMYSTHRGSSVESRYNTSHGHLRIL